jgi:hypothetical protein
MTAVMTTSVSDPPVNNYKFKFPTLICLANASKCLCQKTIIKGFRRLLTKNMFKGICKKCRS